MRVMTPTKMAAFMMEPVILSEVESSPCSSTGSDLKHHLAIVKMSVGTELHAHLLFIIRRGNVHRTSSGITRWV